MAVVCASCQTENRDGAKFCKGCGRRLISPPPASSAPAEERATDGDGWPITERMPLSHGPAADEVTVVTGATAFSPPPAPRPEPAPRPRARLAARARAPKAALHAAALPAARKSNAARTGVFAVLMVGFFYVWKRGDLDWVRAVSKARATPREVPPRLAIAEEPALVP